MHTSCITQSTYSDHSPQSFQILKVRYCELQGKLSKNYSEYFNYKPLHTYSSVPGKLLVIFLTFLEREEHFTQFVCYILCSRLNSTNRVLCCRYASLNMWAFHFHLQHDIRGIPAHFHRYIMARHGPSKYSWT